MCVVTKLLDDHILILKQKRNKVSKEMATYDRKLSNFYHELEGKDFDINEGYLLAKELKEIVESRRNFKFYHHQLCTSIKSHHRVLEELHESEITYCKKFNRRYQGFLLEEEMLLQ